MPCHWPNAIRSSRRPFSQSGISRPIWGPGSCTSLKIGIYSTTVRNTESGNSSCKKTPGTLLYFHGQGLAQTTTSYLQLMKYKCRRSYNELFVSHQNMNIWTWWCVPYFLLYFPLNLTPVCPKLTAFSLTSLATIGIVTLASAIAHRTAAGQTPVDCPQWCLAICVNKWGALILSGDPIIIPEYWPVRREVQGIG